MKRINIGIMLALAAIAILAFAGCKEDRTRISSIIQSPEKYMSKEVAVAGNVTQSYAVNLLITEMGAYQVDDGSGKIWVITRAGVPAEGAQVGLKGTVSSGVKLGREVFGAVIKEQDRVVR